MKNISFQLPIGWEWKTMEEIADVVGGGTPKTNDPSNYEGGTVPWITPADLSGYISKYISRGARSITQKGLSSSSARMIPAGSVLFTSRAPIGYVAIATNDVCTNQGFKSFVLKNGNVLPDYVYWWLKGNKDLAESYGSGTTFLELSGAKAKQLPIPIAPLEQQKRIVAEIEKQFSRLDEAVANLKRVKTNLKRYKAAVLKAAVEGKLTEEWRKAHPDVEPASELLKRILAERRAKWNQRGKYREPGTPDVASFPTLPRGWVWTTVGQLAEIGSGNTPANILDHLQSEGPIPWYKVGDMNRPGNEHVMRSAAGYLSQEAVEKLGLKLFPPGTIIFPKRGGAIATNKKRQLMEGSTTDLNVMGLTPENSVRDYFWWWFSSVDLASLSDGSNVPQVNNKDVLPLTVPLPPLVLCCINGFTTIDLFHDRLD